MVRGSLTLFFYKYNYKDKKEKMSRLTGSEALGLMEAYNAMYAPQINGEQLWEEAGYLTEEFVLESYQTVADYLVNYGVVPGYNTAELFMSEMALEDIDAILFETGILDEEYLMEAGFFQNLGAGADRFVSGAVNKAKQVGQTVSGAAQRAGSAVAGGVKAAAGATQRAGQTAVGAAQRAGSAVAGAAQRAGGAVVRAATPVAQAVKGTAQRAVAAGQSALGGAARAVQGAGQAAVGGAVRAGQAVAGGAVRAGQAVAGGAARAGQAVAGAAQGAARKVGQEIEISRKVGAGEPLGKPGGMGGARPGAAGGAAVGGMGGARPGAAGGAAVGGAKPAPAFKTNPAAGGPPPKTSTSAPPAFKTNPAAGGPPPKPSGPAPAFKTNPAAGSPAAVADAAAAPAAPKKPSLASQTAELRQMRAASRQRQGLTQSFDLFDVIKGHLLDEGYADNEDAALAIMANMSEEWKQSIVEGAGDTSTPADKRMVVTYADKKANTPAYQRLMQGNPAYVAAPHLKGV